MTRITQLLSDTGHRPFELPVTKWRYYQEWNKVLFLHWKVSEAEIRKLVPDVLQIDSLHGETWVSLVAFKMQKIRPKYLPAVKFISEFEEINLRAYVEHEGKKGVYFLSIEADKLCSVVVAKALSGLPYKRSAIFRSDLHCQSENAKHDFRLSVNYEAKGPLKEKSEPDRWLTERYCLYVDKGERCYRYDVHHKEWDLKEVGINALDLDYALGEFRLAHAPDLCHYSDGVQVLAWEKTRIR